MRRLDHEFISGVRLLVGEATRLGEGLEVRYEGKPLKDPYLLLVRIINTGRRAIDEEEFREPVAVEVDQRIVSARVVKTGRLGMRPPPAGGRTGIRAGQVTVNENEARLGGMLFNKNEWVAISLLMDGEPTLRQVHIRVPDVEPTREFKPESYRQWYEPFFPIFGILVGTLVLALLIYPWSVIRDRLGEDSTIVGGLALALLLLAIFLGVKANQFARRFFGRWEKYREESLRVF
jgi:hypothetical protein